MHRPHPLLYFLLSAGLVCTTTDAAERSNIRGMGMARTFVALSSGLDAVGINPAGLALRESGVFTFSVVPTGAHVGSEFLNYDLYRNYFTGVQTDSGRVGRYLNPADKQRILDAFGGDVARSSADAEVRLLGFLVRLTRTSSLAFTVTEQVGVVADIPRDYVSFIFNGNPPGSQFDFGSTLLKGSWKREYVISFGSSIGDGSPLGALSIGAAAKLVHGYGYYEVQRFNTRLSTTGNGILTGSVDFLARQAGGKFLDERSGEQYSPFPEVAGSGFGIDFGVMSQVTESFRIGISVTDIGSMRWSRNVEEVRAESTLVVENPLDVKERDAIEDIIKGRRSSGAPFSTGLPTTLRVGAALSVHSLPLLGLVPGEMLIGVDYNQGLNEVPGTTMTPRASVGVEYTPVAWLPLRSGISFGGTDHFNVALGFGIHLGPIEFDFASENADWFFIPNSFSRGSLAAGLTVRL